MQAIAIATALLDLIPAAVAAGKDITEISQKTSAALKDSQSGPIEPSRWDEINDLIAGLRRELHS